MVFFFWGGGALCMAEHRCKIWHMGRFLRDLWWLPAVYQAVVCHVYFVHIYILIICSQDMTHAEVTDNFFSFFFPLQIRTRSQQPQQKNSGVINKYVCKV